MEQKRMQPARVKVKAWWDLVAARPPLLCSQQDCCFSRALLRSRRAARAGHVWAVLPVWPRGTQIHVFNSALAPMQRWNWWFALVWGTTASSMKNWLCSSLSPQYEIYIFPSTSNSFLPVTCLFGSALVFITCLCWDGLDMLAVPWILCQKAETGEWLSPGCSPRFHPYLFSGIVLFIGSITFTVSCCHSRFVHCIKLQCWVRWWGYPGSDTLWWTSTAGALFSCLV